MLLVNEGKHIIFEAEMIVRAILLTYIFRSGFHHLDIGHYKNIRKSLNVVIVL